MADDLQTALQLLVGEKLSSVTFVMDYLQLDFDGHRFNVFIRTTVKGENWWVPDDDVEFKNRLCERIAHIVRRANCLEDCGIFEFDDGGIIEISLRDQDYRGPEAINFYPRNSVPFYVV